MPQGCDQREPTCPLCKQPTPCFDSPLALAAARRAPSAIEIPDLGTVDWLLLMDGAWKDCVSSPAPANLPADLHLGQQPGARVAQRPSLPDRGEVAPDGFGAGRVRGRVPRRHELARGQEGNVKIGVSITYKPRGMMAGIIVPPNLDVAILAECAAYKFGMAPGDIADLQNADGRILERAHTLEQEGVKAGDVLELWLTGTGV